MKSDPIIDEIWRIKDDLARQAGHDVDRFFEHLTPRAFAWEK